MADVEASVRDLVDRDRDCSEQALSQMGLRRRINLLIAEWKAAGGGNVLPDVGARGRLRLKKNAGGSERVNRAPLNHRPCGGR